jgi:DNA-binding NarL/FixJ family response regulator
MSHGGWDVSLPSAHGHATVWIVADGSFSAEPRSGGSPPSPSVRVLTVDDQPIFLRALRQLIGATPGFSLVGEAQSGEAALELAVQLQPDLVLLDVRMPGMDGVETAQQLLASELRTTIVLFSLEPLLELEPVLEAGVAAFVRKQDLSVATLQSVWAQRRVPAGTPRPA